ncbi:LAMI_0H04676g1_1 [Lachancea mirantina]|uniref:LAMI_0H04676g1_1 n=1 Tax=Lachancea mirantina TaxID=1230905 RepID=A0A1G4KEV7_9SACH|nr:LAMI_0H04676g1_1 [Lachancea mirantina]
MSEGGDLEQHPSDSESGTQSFPADPVLSDSANESTPGVAVERQRKHIDKGDSDDENELSTRERLESQRIINGDNGEDQGLGLDQTHRRRQELEEKLDRILKKPKSRRTRRDEDDLEQFLDERILRLKDEMNFAAQRDIETLNRRLENASEKGIAMEKVKLLPKVVGVLSKANLADTILDNNLLQSVRIWLEPLPDGSLPSFEIQKSLFATLESLPIKTEHLKESGLGKVVIFYTKSKRVEPKLARLADRLIAEWTRPIIGASDNYRDKRVLKMEYDVEQHRKKAQLDSAKNKTKKRKTVEGEDDSKGKSAYELAAARRNRAAAPAQATTDYKYAPVSNMSTVAGSSRVGVGSSLNNSEMFKRLNSRLTKTKTKRSK